MFKYSFVANSHNKKTGAMPVTSTSMDSCPLSCALYADCYGKSGHTRIHWNKLEKIGIDYNQLMNLINALKKKTAIRFNVVGDLAYANGIIDATKLLKLSNVVKNRMLDMILYTHHSIDNVLNVQALKLAFDKGLYVNISCENVEKAKKALSYGLNAVLVVPIDTLEKHKKIDDIHLVHCPAEYKPHIQCVNCMLCGKNRVQNRIVVAFTAHGTTKKRLSEKLNGALYDNL